MIRRLRTTTGGTTDWSTAVLLVAAVGVLSGIAVLHGGEVFTRVVTSMVVLMIIVVGFYLFVGNSGVLSFGHIGFVLIAAYASALQTIPPQLKASFYPNLYPLLEAASAPFPVAVAVGALLASLVAVAISPIVMRLSGLRAGIAMFAFLVIVQVLAINWDSASGAGPGTMVGVPAETSLGVAAVAAVGAILIAFAYQGSPHGRRLRGSREDAAAATALGVSVGRERALAFVLSAFLMGMGGALWAHFIVVFSPNSFFIELTFLVLAMLVVGGLKSLSGAVTGTVVVASLVEVLRRLEQGVDVVGFAVRSRPGVTDLIVALLLLLILVLRPRGLTGGREISGPRLRTAKARSASTVQSLHS